MGLLQRLRSFFYNDDPVVRLTGGLDEPVAEMWREALRNHGVTAMLRNVGAGVSYTWGDAVGWAKEYSLFVKQSDLERARQILGLDDELA